MSMFKIESGIQLLARLTKRPNIENFHQVLFQSGPTSGDFIEIYSETCTSHLLVDIISEALIHTKLKGLPAGVLIFETDGNLNYDELINVIRKKMWSAVNSEYEMYSDTMEFNKEVHETLNNLHILNIYDATQFYTTLYNLESTLVEYPNISLVIFNTVTSFYWSEQGFKVTKMDLYTKNLINMIQKITKEYKIVCMYTRPQDFCTNKDLDYFPMEVKYHIQMLENDNGKYQVNIKTPSNTTITKFFIVKDSKYLWI